MKTKKWTCAYDGTIKKLGDGRCAACGRASKAESQRDAELWDRSAQHPHTPTPQEIQELLDAARDLLDSADDMEETKNDDGKDWTDWGRLRKALAKAEGK